MINVSGVTVRPGDAIVGDQDGVVVAVIATKCGFRSGDAITSCGLSYRYILGAVEASLRRLDTDYIDLYLLHIPDPITPLEETARALDDIVKKGQVRYVGFCNYPAWKAQLLLDIQQMKIKFQPYRRNLARQQSVKRKCIIGASGNGNLNFLWSHD